MRKLTEKAVTAAPSNPKRKTPQSLISCAFFSFRSLSSLFISESKTNNSTIQRFQSPIVPQSKFFFSLTAAIAIYFSSSPSSGSCSTKSPESIRSGPVLLILIRIITMTWHQSSGSNQPFHLLGHNGPYSIRPGPF